ncbi:MAG TPA: hypothetical protein VK983_00735, partial [Candidatus Limnocylindrales bacterium]|nr:hypothetical protein [Candidatus Limnocylindrales bacterium]
MASKVSRRTIAALVVEKLIAPGADRKHVMQSLAGYLVERNLTRQADMIMNDIAAELQARTGVLSVEVT